MFFRHLIAITLFLVVSTAAADDAIVWQSLGTSSVPATPFNSKPQKGQIHMMSARGPFTSIRLGAVDGTVALDYVVISFAHGTAQRVDVKKTLAPGAFTPVIQLAGTDHVIRKVSFGYTAPKFMNLRLYAR